MKEIMVQTGKKTFYFLKQGPGGVFISSADITALDQVLVTQDPDDSIRHKNAQHAPKKVIKEAEKLLKANAPS